MAYSFTPSTFLFYTYATLFLHDDSGNWQTNHPTLVEMKRTTDDDSHYQSVPFDLVTGSSTDLRLVTLSVARPGPNMGVLMDVRVTTSPGGVKYYYGATSGLMATDATPPTVTRMTPSSGPPAGGTVTLTGTLLNTVTQVLVNNIPVPFYAIAPTTLTFTMPPGAPAGVGFVELIAAGVGTRITAGTYTYNLPPGCKRSAWLTLGSQTVYLEDQNGGWFCTSLDLGYPEVRDVVNNRPDQNGIDDRTQLFGARTISAAITTLDATAPVGIDAVAAQFAPFMVASARPTLHYVLERPGNPERTMKLRPANYDWPIAGPFERDIQLQWVAADPAALDPVEKTTTAWSGSSSVAGRTYNLTFPRTYPAGGGSRVAGRMQTNGDLPVRPRIRIYGPATGPAVAIQTPDNVLQLQVAFSATYVLGAGHFIDVDTEQRTAYLDGDTSQSLIQYIAWGSSLWGSVPTGQNCYVNMFATSTSGVTQAQVFWHDRYLV